MSEWQREVLKHVLSAGKQGLTAPEVQLLTGKGHGAVSAALSRLHAAGDAYRLKEKRERHSVYVARWKMVDGREVLLPKGRIKKTEPCDRPECLAMEALYADLSQELADLKKEVGR